MTSLLLRVGFIKSFMREALNERKMQSAKCKTTDDDTGPVLRLFQLFIKFAVNKGKLRTVPCLFLDCTIKNTT